VDVLKFVHLAFVGFFALFPPVNPIGTALMMDPLLHGLDGRGRKAAALRITIYCFTICTGAVLGGGWLLRLFGVSLPVVQLAGGILICKMGWDLLSSGESAKESGPASATHDLNAIEGRLFYPVAFPMTTGAGTISVLLTLSAHAQTDPWSAYVQDFGALLVAIVLMCILIYLCYAYTPWLLGRLGARGEQIVNRLSAFLVFCVGIQIAVSGISNLVQSRHA
jgi:multiple antibiotic resistance protein